MEKTAGKILIIDDDQDVLFTAQMVLKRHFSEVKTAHSPKGVMPLLEKEAFEVILLDMNFAPGVTSGQEGLFWLRKIKKVLPAAQVILNTAYGDVELAVEGMRQGATDFLLKPWKHEKLLSSVRMVMKLGKAQAEVGRLKQSRKAIQSELAGTYPPLLSQAASMQKVFETIEKVAKTDATVLVLGENGTGKELVARDLHRQSPRYEEAFIKVDLGAIPETLFESELFGHNKGAFTDAKEDKAGRFEVAAGGSLFLDEIGNLSFAMQAKLLTVLQARQLTRIGATQSIPLDIRLICATNKPLYEMVEQQAFRQDLLYRINTVEIQLPPLRERLEDLPLLGQYFLNQYAEKYGKGQMKFNRPVWKKMQAYPWPGNIRELQHAIERAVILADRSSLSADDFPLGKRAAPASATEDVVNMEEIEKRAILAAIKKCEGNYTQAAKELGFGRSTLYRKMEKYGLQ
ncbi:MAG: sigma-54 dependent transcriptional regulator [Bacteroidota bacterium]